MERGAGDGREARQAAARIIREGSEAGRLLSRLEIRTRLIALGALGSEGDEPSAAAKLESLLEEAVAETGDLREIHGPDQVSQYYSLEYLSESYARLLLLKRGNPLDLIAETVREDSARYPRPTSLLVFEGPPFDLTAGQIRACLDQMVRQAGYEDIARITTSVGTVFLYSARHLDPSHASMLAEWLEVGQFNSP